MISTPTLQATKQRLASHYLTRLRAAERALQQSTVNKQYGKNLLDKEWLHITRWQQHAASMRHTSEDWAQLCRDYGRESINTIFFTCTTLERIAWWTAALEGARQVGDTYFERTFLNKLAGEYSALGQLDQVKAYALELFSLAQKDNDQSFIANAIYQLATIAEDQGNYDEAVEYYEQALAHYERVNFEVKIGRTVYGLGTIALYRGRYAEAHQYFMRYRDLTVKPGREVDHCYALQGVAETLQNLGQLEEAESIFRQAVNLSRQIGFQNAVGPSLIGLGTCLLNRGQINDAFSELVEGLGIAREYSGIGDVLHALTSLGRACWQLGQFERALTYLLEAQEKATQSELRLHQARIHRYMGLVYLELGQIENSRKHFRDMMLANRQLGSVPEAHQALLFAAFYAARMGLAQVGVYWLRAVRDGLTSEDPVAVQVRRELVSALGAARYQALLEQGEALSVEAAHQQVIQQLEQTARYPE